MRNPLSSSSAASTVEVSAGVAKTTPCCSKVGLKRGPWTPEEDELLANYINKEGEGRWRTLPKRAGLLRCGKSCRLRWMNYLRPCVKRGHIAPDEEDLILRLHRLLGNRWSLIAGRIPGRTDNEIKNYWNTHLSKKLISQGIDPRTHKPLTTDHVQIRNSSSSNNNNNNNSSNKQKDVSLTTSRPSAPQNPNQMLPPYNSNDSNSGVVVGAVDFQIKANNSTTEFCFDPTRNSTNYHPNVYANGLVLPNHHHHHHHLNFEASFYGTKKNNDNACGESPAGSFEDQEEDPNYCSDDIFSSFLNSLINEDMFTSQSQQQLPRYDALLSTTSQPNSAAAAAALGIGTTPAWDTITPAAAFHHNISPDDHHPH